MQQSRPFISGEKPAAEYPLSRFLPPFKHNVFTQLAAESAAPGSIILDPFGTSPRMVVELAKAGYQVVSVCSNPVTRFLMRMAGEDVSPQEINAALALLANSRVGDERLEIHLRDLYATSCIQCGAAVEADAFIWQKEPRILQFKQYTCTACGQSGTFDVSADDQAKAARFTGDKLTRARALSKIAPTDDPDRPTAEKSLNKYLPRALYGLFTAINRFEALTLTEDKHSQISFILLNALDKSSTLWGFPEPLKRPKQLVAPPQFTERNLWKCMEEAAALWPITTSSLPVYDLRKNSPADSNAPGIWVFPGRMKDLGNLNKAFQPDLAAAVIPRPAPAYWMLSLLWGSWLWGKEILGGFRSVIRRERFDWAWHTAALRASLKECQNFSGGCKLMTVMYETEPAFELAALLAADSAGYAVSGLALHPEESELQLRLEKPSAQMPKRDRWAEDKTAEAAAEFLRSYGMPAVYQQLQLAGLLGLANEQHLVSDDEDISRQYYNLRDMVEGSFSYKQGFVRYGGSEKSAEAGKWWLTDDAGVQEAAADRLEQKLVNHLIKQQCLKTAEIENFVQEAFPGIMLPSKAGIFAVLDSYADCTEGNIWIPKPADAPAARRADLDLIRELISFLGGRLGYEVVKGNPMIWMDENQELAFSFQIIASALIDKIVFNAHFEPHKSIIVIPGSRSNLIAYKLANNPRLQQKVREGWHFLKFRRVRWLAENPTVGSENFVELIDQDPLLFNPPQERLL